MTVINLNLPDSDIRYYPSFLEPEAAGRLFTTLRDTTPWRQEKVRVFGKWYNQPRLTALAAINDKPYTYSGLELRPVNMSAEVLELKNKVEALSGKTFTTCLLNYYREGRDSNGWHADDEKELGKNPVIASVSLGAERVFHLKHKTKALKHKMELENGSLLLMAGETQHHWQHQLPKTKRPVGGRVNLTFRYIQ